jgi:hypothetical protein
MARPSNAQRRFAELFVSGPDYVRGQWQQCAVAAGMKDVPPLTDNMLRRLIEAIGGQPPEVPDANLQAAKAAAEAVAAAAAAAKAAEPPADDTPDPIAQLELARELGLPWAEMRNKLKDVIESVANGSVRASAAQVTMLKYIIEQAKADVASNELTLGVVLLPTQGKAATLELDKAAKRRAQEAINAKS